MAPELMGGTDDEPDEPVVTQKSDVYAFGMVVLEVGSDFLSLARTPVIKGDLSFSPISDG
jgi:serine/threonine protein kinase